MERDKYWAQLAEVYGASGLYQIHFRLHTGWNGEHVVTRVQANTTSNMEGSQWQIIDIAFTGLHYMVVATKETANTPGGPRLGVSTRSSARQQQQPTVRKTTEHVPRILETTNENTATPPTSPPTMLPTIETTNATPVLSEADQAIAMEYVRLVTVAVDESRVALQTLLEQVKARSITFAEVEQTLISVGRAVVNSGDMPIGTVDTCRNNTLPHLIEVIIQKHISRLEEATWGNTETGMTYNLCHEVYGLCVKCFQNGKPFESCVFLDGKMGVRRHRNPHCLLCKCPHSCPYFGLP
jgi:hypothetical protein